MEGKILSLCIRLRKELFPFYKIKQHLNIMNEYRRHGNASSKSIWHQVKQIMSNDFNIMYISFLLFRAFKTLLLLPSLTFVLEKHEFHRHVKFSSHHGWQNHCFHIYLYFYRQTYSLQWKTPCTLTCEVVDIPLCNQIPALAMQPQGPSSLSFIFSFHACEVNAILSYVEGHHED